MDRRYVLTEEQAVQLMKDLQLVLKVNILDRNVEALDALVFSMTFLSSAIFEAIEEIDIAKELIENAIIAGLQHHNNEMKKEK